MKCLRPLTNAILPIAILLLTGFAAASAAQDSTIKRIQALQWIKGPGTVRLFDIASVRIPVGYMMLTPEDAKTFLTLTENIPHDNIYILAPDDFRWWSDLSFSRDGYVKDDEQIDAPQILQSITRGNERANEERRSRGWGTLSIVGWQVAPFYNTETKRLEWAIKAKSDPDNQEVINFNTRLLGRSGITSAQLMVEPAAFATGVNEFKKALEGFDYLPAESYAAFKPGDKIAAYGLTGLIVGGAAAVATKTGFWKVLGVFLVGAWKFVVAAVVAAVAALKRLFTRKES